MPVGHEWNRLAVSPSAQAVREAVLPVSELPISCIAPLAFVCGACVGSFLNVCIYRVPLGRSVVAPRSQCLHCSGQLAWYDTLPLVSYMVLGGRCRTCGARFPFRYVFVEALTGLLSALIVYRFGLSLTGLGFFVLSAALVVVSFIDLDHQIIPDAISLPGVLLGVIFAGVNPAVGWQSALIGAALGGSILFAVALGYQTLTGRQGMGGGDVKLLAMIGAFLGWRAVPFTLLLASCLGSVVGLGMMIRQRSDTRLTLPFGPFLACGALSYVFFGEALVAWYFEVLG